MWHKGRKVLVSLAIAPDPGLRRSEEVGPIEWL